MPNKTFGTWLRKCKAASSVFIQKASSSGLKGKMSGMHLLTGEVTLVKNHKALVWEEADSACILWWIGHPQGCSNDASTQTALQRRLKINTMRHSAITQMAGNLYRQNAYYLKWQNTFIFVQLVVIMCSAFHNILPSDKLMLISYFIYWYGTIYSV